MPSCPSCSCPVPDGSRFCGSCGAAVGAAPVDPTRTSVSLGSWGRGSPVGAVSNEALEPRFAPGAMLAGRYRVVGLIGRGGMGEVYRADDLKLARPVALKFLPAEVEHDPHRLGRLLDEVRVALKVTHPNVCRVHDIGEAGGLHYISMEYVDGEDLVSLLRRVGHLPQDRAARVARQLCAGLAAAHDQGVLHRDLKPANVMIDGRGNVKITDFGLAAAAGEVRGAEVRAGTPAYMSPEQLAGEEVTPRSDIYSLGLVLYEIFTGARAFEGTTPAELRKQRVSSAPASMSRIVKELDPAVERVVMRCLSADPASRPASPLAVSAALPGGDPLAAALAAGETPSPRLLAEAGEAGGLAPAWAVSLFAVFLLGIAGIVARSHRLGLAGMVPLAHPPEVLVQKAREVVHRIGIDDPPADSLYAFLPNDDYLRHLLETAGPDRFAVLRKAQPSALPFWYRQSPALLVKQNSGAIGAWISDPPRDLPGMVEISLDSSGRLRTLVAVPPERPGPEASPGEVDWRPLLEVAGFDPGALEPTQPDWSPPVYADRVVAWAGVYPDARDVRLRIHAASCRGQPVWFRVIEPWTRAVEPGPLEGGIWVRTGQAVNTIWFAIVLVGAGWVAIRNVGLGRGDRRTALRFALYLAGLRLLWFLGAHHVAANAELDLFTWHLAAALYRFGLVYVFYLAFEPYARRLWPRMLVSWVRVFDGRLRDPLVGRDLLVGVSYGLAATAVFTALGLIPGMSALERYGPTTEFWSFESLRGFRQALTAVLGVHTQSLFMMFFGILMFLVLRILLRRTWIAIGLFSLLALPLFYPGRGNPLVYVVAFVLLLPLFWLVLFRFGLLPVVVGATVNDLLRQMPIVPDLASWRGAPTVLTLAVLVALGAWGFWVSLAGRPLLRDELQEP